MRFSKRIHAILMIYSLMNKYFIIQIINLNKQRKLRIQGNSLFHKVSKIASFVLRLILILQDRSLTNMNPKILSINYRSSCFKKTIMTTKRINYKTKKYSPMKINLTQEILNSLQAVIPKTTITLIVLNLKCILTKITSKPRRALVYSA